MKIVNVKDVIEEEVKDGRNATIRWLIDEKTGINFAMRYFVIKKNGYTPFHTHEWEHEIFVVKGEGYVFNGRDRIKIKTGDAVFIAPNEPHQIVNDESDSLEIICLIPIRRT